MTHLRVEEAGLPLSTGRIWKKALPVPVLGCAQGVTGALMEAELCAPSVEWDGEEGL